ncbi:MAG: transcriptional regulator, Crp/Fnr family [uncultured Thiotrichaceae bacterium]|uniref:Transcriptional regulator, Crp/Fnr family n=1 Tax=uncultured Thiotrichaceae bacterium TaxID=298394 RepID=A0A6S6SRN9_9GAMM|nr:MAG: transcriptional regulator, Crp/Fnr family [uncultured Thiotrichaceae bacterium]
MSHIKAKGECKTCSIRNLSIFARLPEDRFDEINCFHPSVITYDPDETIYHQNEKAKNAFTLRQGLIKLVKVLPNGKNQIVKVLRRGDLFGFDGFADENYNHMAIPLTNVEVCRLPLKELLELKKQNPEIEQTMMKRWIQHLREAEDMMVELGAKKGKERLATFLLKWCECKNSNQWIELPLSRSEIGELLGLTIETVSRFLSEWKRQEFIIEQRGSIQLVDIEGLKQAACSDGNC